MEQQDGETVAQFFTRLRQVVKDCDYGDQAENQIRDQVVQRCKSHELRKKLLEKGEKLTLELLSTAANHEGVQSQLENMEGKNDVNSVRDKQEDKGKEPATDVEKWDILDETLNAPQEEKLAISAEELTILDHSVTQKQPNLPNLDGKRSQKERKRRSQSDMWEVREMKMNMHLL